MASGATPSVSASTTYKSMNYGDDIQSTPPVTQQSMLVPMCVEPQMSPTASSKPTSTSSKLAGERSGLLKKDSCLPDACTRQNQKHVS